VCVNENIKNVKDLVFSQEDNPKVMVSVAVSQVGITTDICQPWGEGERPVLLRCLAVSAKSMLPAIKRVAEHCLFTKQYVACGELVIFVFFSHVFWDTV